MAESATDIAGEVAVSALTEEEFNELHQLMGELRKLKRDDLFVPVARLQLLYLMRAAEAVTDKQSEQRIRILKTARSNAYNIASFTWPGWGDTGPIAEEKQHLGRSAAKVGLAISEEINDVNPTILWMNGAHALNAADYDVAIDYFERGRQLARSEFFANMHASWIALCRSLQDPTEAHDEAFERALALIRDSDHEQSTFFSEQVVTAARTFRLRQP